MTRSNMLGILAGLAATLSATTAGQVLAAQVEPPNRSAYGCRNLESIPDLQMIEGKDGMFYRVLAEIRLQHSFTGETVRHMAQLSKALEAGGTKLIYLPVPTKAHVLPQFVPDEAVRYGFDADVALAVYLDVVKRLNDAGVLAVDVATDMRAHPVSDKGDYTFFKTDFHWTAQGARLAAGALARAIAATPAYQDLPRSAYEIVESMPETEVSSMRRVLQVHCVESVPPVTAFTYKTVAKETPDATQSGDLDLFGGGQGPDIALAGTSFSDKANNNFAGFIQYETGLAVENYSISGGNQFGSILSYLTSREFQEQRPRFLIWENPIYNNLGQYGDGPWKEILAAAWGDCQPIAASLDDAQTTIATELGGRKLSRDEVLLVDAGQDGARKLVARFAAADGIVRERIMERGDRMRATGRFFVSMAGLPQESLTSATFRFDTPASPEASVSVCKTTQGEQS